METQEKRNTFEKQHPVEMTGRFKKSGEMIILDSRNLSEYILAKLGSMNQLKLQKLIYYVEAYHQAYFDQPIIVDEFEAWVHGPVSRKVWNEYRELSTLYANFSFTDESDAELVIEEIGKKLSHEQQDLIQDVLDEYGPLSSYKLECLTHEEIPWREARQGVAAGDPSTNVIRKMTMRTFYKQMLYSN